ncbi:hypothetical protein LTR17_018586 [Elasticomyces elasticus]|nr:hypothetical protein LTR17_018586 [Elasticomyces elasticus]
MCAARPRSTYNSMFVAPTRNLGLPQKLQSASLLLFYDPVLAPSNQSLELHNSMKAPLPARYDPMLVPLDYCPLLSLPAELRNIIYELVLRLAPDDETFVSLSRRPSPSDPKGIRSVLTVLRTCRQINNEAGGIFYSLNQLSVGRLRSDPYQDSVMFLASLGDARRQAIRHLAVTVDCKRPQTFRTTLWKLQTRCTHLMSLRVYITGLAGQKDYQEFEDFIARDIQNISFQLRQFKMLQHCELRNARLVLYQVVAVKQDTLRHLEAAFHEFLVRCKTYTSPKDELN